MVKKIKNIGDLKFDSKNINKGTERGGELLKKSLQEVGAGRSVLADMNGVLIAGNKTIEQAAGAGISKIRVVQTTGDEIVVVQRTDIDINSVEGAKMKILDNTVSKHNYLEDAEISEAICEEVHLEPAEYGLGAGPKGSSEVVGNFDDAGIISKSQYGVIVICPTEGEQAKIYGELIARGLTCKIVVT